MRRADVDGHHQRDVADSRHAALSRQAPDAVDGEDEVAASLHQAHELIKHAISRRGRHSPQIQHLGVGGAFDAAVEEMFGRAREEVFCLLSPRETRSPIFHHLQAARQRGVRVKVLVPNLVTAANTEALRRMSKFPGYRTRRLPEQDLVIVDGREAAFRTPHREHAPAQAVLITVHPLARVLRTMFDATWSSSAPLAEVFRVREQLHDERARSVLSSLSAGETDEVAARKLGISVRTYRRHVAGIMQDMQVSSRFQAGVRAVELGIIGTTRAVA